MSDIKPTTNSSLPDRLYGEHYPDSFIDMPQPLFTSRHKLMDDNGKYVREERQQSDQPIITSQSVGTCSGSYTPSATASSTATTSPSGSTTNRQYRDPADPDQDGFADNIEYTNIEGPPLPANTIGKDEVSSWPCVVVGAVPQTWVSTAERILRTTASKWDTKQHTDARHNYDGFIKANGI
jgi:hypothetical protein